jgi:light-regulated signal transduction histidine kinase (bacteriophytochrome)
VHGRYELGFYMGRLYGFFAVCFILSVLLRETISLYGQAVRLSTVLREREEQLKNFNALLEKEVAEQTRELTLSKELLQEKNEQLQQTIKQLESFNYLTSHDLQEPLRKIQTFVELLHEYKQDEHMRDEYSEKIRKSSIRMSKLIQSLLDYSRLSRSDVTFQPTDLNTILEQVKSDYHASIIEKQAVIQCNDLPVIRAIPFQMYQLFSNLIDNSLKFCDTIPEITITCNIVSGDKIDIGTVKTSSIQFAEIRFSDNGIGFDNKYKEKMFRIFQRLHPLSKYSGTGIGLSIVEKIIQNHHGYIEATGEKNQGATFTIYLPFL